MAYHADGLEENGNRLLAVLYFFEWGKYFFCLVVIQISVIIL